MITRTRLPYLDGEPFICMLEDAQDEGNLECVEQHMPRLERLIAKYMDRVYELTKLQQRAREIRGRHELPAAKR